MLGVIIILGFTALGNAIGDYTGMPGVLVGLVFLALALWSGLLKEEWLTGGGDFFLKHLTLFFVPAALGIVDYFDILAAELVNIFLVITISTLLAIVVTGWVTQWAGDTTND